MLINAIDEEEKIHPNVNLSIKSYESTYYMLQSCKEIYLTFARNYT